MAIRMHEATVEQAKAVAGLDIVPVYGGSASSLSYLKHDGYKLKTPAPQNTCGNPPPLTQTLPFKTRTTSMSGLGELDLTRSFGLSASQMLRVGAAVGWKSLRTETDDVRTPFVVNTGPGHVDEDGIQVDLYALLVDRTMYALFAASLGRGDSDLSNTSHSAPGGVLAIGSASTDYRDYSLSATVGNVFTLSSGPDGRMLADVSGGLLYSSYTRDGFVDTVGGRFSDADVDEMAGKVELKLAYQMMRGADVFTPYVKLGVKHRFNYDNTLTFTDNFILRPAVTMNYNLESDDTFWRAGGGLSTSFNGGGQTGLVEVMYQGSGDSREVLGKAQYVIKLR